MESTGGSDKGKPTISNSKDFGSDQYKFFPSIHEQELDRQDNSKKLETLIEKYMRPVQKADKSLNI